jgi:hypothetical protein
MRVEPPGCVWTAVSVTAAGGGGGGAPPAAALRRFRRRGEVRTGAKMFQGIGMIASQLKGKES